MKKPSLLLTISLLCGGLLISVFQTRIAFFIAEFLKGFDKTAGQIELVFGFFILIPAVFFTGILAMIIGMVELNLYMKWRKSLTVNIK